MVNNPIRDSIIVFVTMLVLLPLQMRQTLRTVIAVAIDEHGNVSFQLPIDTLCLPANDIMRIGTNPFSNYIYIATSYSTVYSNIVIEPQYRISTGSSRSFAC